MRQSSSPPTLLDRLTRLDAPAQDQANPPDPSSTTYGAPPVLSDIIDEHYRASGRMPSLSDLQSSPYRETEYKNSEYRPTDFAITNVTVPDRLDQREVRDRAEEEYKRPGLFSFDRYLLGLWVRRLFVLTLLTVLGFWAYRTVMPIRAELAPERISQRLSSQTGLPVQVTDVTYRASPSPRVVLSGVQIGKDLRLDEVAVRVNWKDAWSALAGSKLNLGEATVSPLRLTEAKLWSLLEKASALTTGLPDSLSTLRFESVEVADVPLIKGAYELVLRRGVGGAFGPILVTQLGTASPLTLSVVSSPAPDRRGEDPPRYAFQFDARDFVLPFNPGSKWGEVVASGFFRPGLIEVESYMLAGNYGVVRGALYAASDLQWEVTGYARGTGLDVESIVAGAAKLGAAAAADEANAPLVPFAGTATMDLAVLGRGDALAEAAEKSVAAGPVQVRSAAIRGINLGYVATHGGSTHGLGSGYTRFADFDALFVADPEGVSLRNVLARAGALTMRGDVRMATDRALNGQIAVDLGVVRPQAPVSLKVRGDLMAPQFVR